MDRPDPWISSDERPERPPQQLGAPPGLARFEVRVQVGHLANPLLAVERLLATDAGAYAQVIGDEERFEVRVALPTLADEDVAAAAAWVRWAVHHAGLRGEVHLLPPT
jgi:hypothetical protein